MQPLEKPTPSSNQSTAAKRLVRYLDACGNRLSEIMHLVDKVHEDYKSIREFANARKAIIYPIKAVVIRTDDCNKIIDKVASLVKLSDISEEYKRNLSTVGYMIAFPDDQGEIRCGISFCQPADFEGFSKEVGICLAFNTLMLDTDIDSNFDAFSSIYYKLLKNAFITERADICYITYAFHQYLFEEQFDRFISKAKHYYKQDLAFDEYLKEYKSIEEDDDEATADIESEKKSGLKGFIDKLTNIVHQK